MAAKSRSAVIVALWVLTLAILMVGGCCATSEGGFWQYAFGAGLPAVAALCTWVLADGRTAGEAALWDAPRPARKSDWKTSTKKTN